MNKEEAQQFDATRNKAINAAEKNSNSQLLMEYRDALMLAYKLGDSLKQAYGIIPPKIIFWDRKEAHMQLVPTTLVLSVG